MYGWTTLHQARVRPAGFQLEEQASINKHLTQQIVLDLVCTTHKDIVSFHEKPIHY